MIPIARTQINMVTDSGQQSGECFLKIIVHESYLDSNATVTTMRLNLINLDEYMTTNGSDIVAFNAYVQSQIDGLAARGEITSNLLVNLFKGYKMVKDKPFLDYLQTIENGHEDGSAVVDAPHLMLCAVNFYKNRLTRKAMGTKITTGTRCACLRSEGRTTSEKCTT